jgi:hypothetical protein
MHEGEVLRAESHPPRRATASASPTARGGGATVGTIDEQASSRWPSSITRSASRSSGNRRIDQSQDGDAQPLEEGEVQSSCPPALESHLHISGVHDLVTPQRLGGMEEEGRAPRWSRRRRSWPRSARLPTPREHAQGRFSRSDHRPTEGIPRRSRTRVRGPGIPVPGLRGRPRGDPGQSTAVLLLPTPNPRSRKASTVDSAVFCSRRHSAAADRAELPSARYMPRRRTHFKNGIRHRDVSPPGAARTDPADRLL